jgi:hypothetical protein
VLPVSEALGSLTPELEAEQHDQKSAQIADD